MSKQHGEPAADRAEKSGGPTVTQGGSMPGASESGSHINAYPRADATQPGSLPRPIAEGMDDPTGGKNRDQLLALAQTQKIDGVATMDRHELADALKSTMSQEDLVAALAV